MLIARIFTLYPEFFPGPLGKGLYGKALAENIWKLETINIRDYTTDKHKTVDDTTYGGGSGMLIKPDVLANSLDKNLRSKEKIIYLSPKGKLFNQKLAKELSKEKTVNLICGHFEGIDQRVIEARNIEEVSIGAILVLSGAFCWSVGQVMIKDLRGNVKGLTLICWIGIFCTPQMMFLSAIIDGNPIPYILSANLNDWFTVIYLGLIMTVLGYSIWFYILTKYPIPIAMPFLLLIPVSAILGAMIFFGDRPNFDILLGGGIIVFGLAVIIIEPKILFTKLKTGR